MVTDDRGRYVVPDLPKANYSVWVRGYGLVDSPKVQTAPGKTVNLTAVVAPNARAAAEYYPASYWYSLLKPPDKSEFPGTGPSGNGISPNMKSQAQFLELIKTDSCWSCHQLGNKATRKIPESLGTFDSPAKAWERRIQSGQAGGNMMGGLGQMGKERALAMFADWTNRIAAGELPPAPPRPQGAERNVVITEMGLGGPEGVSARRDRDRQAQSHRQRQRACSTGLPRRARTTSPCSTRCTTPTSQVKMPVRDPKTPGRRTSRCSLRPIGATKPSGTARPPCTTPCSTRRGACGSRR